MNFTSGAEKLKAVGQTDLTDVPTVAARHGCQFRFVGTGYAQIVGLLAIGL